MQPIFENLSDLPMLLLLVFSMVFCIAASARNHPATFVLKCSEKNDLYKMLLANDIAIKRVDTAEEAIESAAEKTAVLILADDYPNDPIQINKELFQAAIAKKLRLYLEFPAKLPGLAVSEPRHTEWERGVVVSDFFGAALPPMRIVMVHDCSFVPVTVERAELVLARVAGFDTAVYGLDATESHPLLFEHPNFPFLIATSKLSQFISGRYAPADAWDNIWQKILNWLQPGVALPDLRWQPGVRPSREKGAELPADAEVDAITRGVGWYFNAKLLLHPSTKKIYEQALSNWADATGPMPDSQSPGGDGSLGVLEGFSSNIKSDGSQKLRWWLRYDCNGEVTGSIALASQFLQNKQVARVAGNLGDFIYFKSLMSQGNRMNPMHPAFGLISWNHSRLNDDKSDFRGVYYGDDNARGLLGTLAAAAMLKIDRWDERMLQCLIANFRTTGPLGFRWNRIDEEPLEKHGWRFFFENASTSYAPHYQAFLWACFLKAYSLTGYDLFLERTKIAIRMTMEAYPDEWHWTNGIQQERARMLLPLAWLVYVEDKPEHRNWLKFMVEELLAYQHQTGAIREALGKAGKGSYGAPKSNAAYGTDEAPLLQVNGDPVCDLLYTTNFAFIGLHEAAAATKEPYYRQAEDRLAEFLCRIQVRSESRPELDGAWFRAMDFERWEYWASNADAGWGAWSTETGWTQGWITMVLALRQMNLSLWELTSDSDMGRHFQKTRQLMLP
ncbi:hypothetical protein JXJ21_17430 [candidate division KSB1 bacterium]|nr:hypothetical protein [candidate division KSB1 bacterium]